MGTQVSKLVINIVLLASVQVALGQDEDGYYGILNANEALIDSVSNESGTRTGDFSTKALLGPTENAQWQLDGPVVVAEDGEVIGQLSTFDGSTTSLFNPTIYEKVPFDLRCEACIGSMNDSFSTKGPKIYDSQSETYKAKLEEVFEYEPVQR